MYFQHKSSIFYGKLVCLNCLDIRSIFDSNYLSPKFQICFSPNYRAAVCDIICLEAVVLPGGKTMEHLYGNGRKFSLFSLTSLLRLLNIYNTKYQ